VSRYIILLLWKKVIARGQRRFWDPLIIASASQAYAEKIVTEELSRVRIIEGILIENPFVK
jgi:predicted nucleic acid-binding protein